MTILIVLALLAALTLAGVAIPWAMSAATFLYFFVLSDLSAQAGIRFFGQQIIGLATHYTFVTIPLFVLYGRIAEEMQARERLAALVRRVIGGGRVAATVAEVVSGLAVPDAAGEALLNRTDTAADSINRLRLAGTGGFSATAQSAALTLMRTLMPPGIIVFVLAIMVEECIAVSWIGLAVLGLSIGILTVLLAALSPVDGQPGAPAAAGAGAAIWGVAAVAVIFLLIAGITTATEAAAIAVVVAVVTALVGGVTGTRLLRATGRALQDSGTIFLTMALANALAAAVALEGGARTVQSLVQASMPGPTQLVPAIVLSIALISSALGPLLTLLVAAPILVPTATALGIEPGTVILIFATAAALGSLIPPLGPVYAALAAGSSLSRARVAQAMAMALTIGLFAVLATPALAAALTGWLLGP